MNEVVDQGRRHLLTAATVGAGAIGVAFAAVPFLASWKPSARAKALGAPVEVDASQLEAGQMMKVIWRGQPVYVLRRPKALIAAIGAHDTLLADPKSLDSQQPTYIENTGAVRALNPEYWIGLAVCTHLSCSPLGAFEPNNSSQIAGVDSPDNLRTRQPGAGARSSSTTKNVEDSDRHDLVLAETAPMTRPPQEVFTASKSAVKASPPAWRQLPLDRFRVDAPKF